MDMDHENADYLWLKLLFAVLVIMGGVLGAVLVSVIALNMTPQSIWDNPLTGNYDHEMEKLLCVFITGPIGSFLGGLTGLSYSLWSMGYVKSAGRICSANSRNAAIFLLIWGCHAVAQQFKLVNTRLYFQLHEPTAYLQDYSCICGFPILWVILLMVWGRRLMKTFS